MPDPDRSQQPGTADDLAAGTTRLLAAVRGLGDRELDAPSALPGWTRRHLLAHLASNAEALTRLSSWAATGVESRMYASAGQRRSEIESGAARPAVVLRERLTGTADTLGEALAAIPASRHAAEVVTAQGRTVPATEIWWLRTREVWLHGLDLDAGIGVGELPDRFCRRLVVEVAAWRTARADGPAVTFAAPDDPSVVGQLEGSSPQVEVRAPLATLAGWLTGRAGIPGAPALPPWI